MCSQAKRRVGLRGCDMEPQRHIFAFLDVYEVKFDTPVVETDPPRLKFDSQGVKSDSARIKLVALGVSSLILMQTLQRVNLTLPKFAAPTAQGLG